MKFIIGLSLLLLNGPFVRCLQCYTCNSTISMDDCSLNESKISCPAQLSSGFCGRMEVKDENKGTHIFSKGCYSEDACTGDAFPCKEGGVYCKGDCCFYGLCNGEGQVAEQISCNHCTSSISLDDCTEHQKPQKCSVGWNQCGILETPSQAGGSSYLKGCFARQTCEKFCAGGHNDVIGIKCKLTCCGDRELCN
ncbi:uncharacterized protein LOC141876707 [Acropora palmata]|uniref:uncharacterized protein LOC141876707 n=1 Tax=Acropora palmata TaxID=6131 RepID=UPI003DA0E2F7